MTLKQKYTIQLISDEIYFRIILIISKPIYLFFLLLQRNMIGKN